jgi:hypothetical protein
MWYYKDLQGQVRGPFSQTQMSQWYDMGYFTDDLELAYGENSLFLPLKSYKEIGIAKFSTPKQNVGQFPFNSAT